MIYYTTMSTTNSGLGSSSGKGSISVHKQFSDENDNVLFIVTVNNSLDNSTGIVEQGTTLEEACAVARGIRKGIALATLT